MPDIDDIMASDTDAAEELETEGATEYAHEVIDQEKFIDPNDGDAPEKEAETIEGEPAVHEIAKEPFDGEEELTAEES